MVLVLHFPDKGEYLFVAYWPAVCLSGGIFIFMHLLSSHPYCLLSLLLHVDKQHGV